MTPAEIIAHRRLVTQGELSSADWQRFSTAVKSRAFFSAHVESAKFLDEARTVIADLLANAKNDDGAYVSRAEAVSRIMQAARQCGIAQGGETVRDPGSEARANVIIDTNAGMAAGYVRAVAANTYGARLAFPAQELIRVEQRKQPRRWDVRWEGAGGRLYHGRMIALKDDPIWIRISAFGNPYPPFDFNSGMGLEDVSYDEAVRLGVIEDGYQPPEASPIDTFDTGLEVSLEFKNDQSWQKLKQTFGDQIRQANGKIQWRHDVIRDAFQNREQFSMTIGVPSDRLLSMAPKELAAVARGRQLSVSTSAWLDRKRSNGSNYYDHFEPLESHTGNIPLTVDDIELIPVIWQHPDRVSTDTVKKAYLLLESTMHGGVYHLVVAMTRNPYVVTFYKTKVQ